MGRNWHFTNRSHTSKSRIISIVKKRNGELIVIRTQPIAPSAAWRRKMASLKAFD